MKQGNLCDGSGGSRVGVGWEWKCFFFSRKPSPIGVGQGRGGRNVVRVSNERRSRVLYLPKRAEVPMIWMVKIVESMPGAEVWVSSVMMSDTKGS